MREVSVIMLRDQMDPIRDYLCGVKRTYMVWQRLPDYRECGS